MSRWPLGSNDGGEGDGDDCPCDEPKIFDRRIEPKLGVGQRWRRVCGPGMPQKMNPTPAAKSAPPKNQ